MSGLAPLKRSELGVRRGRACSEQRLITAGGSESREGAAAACVSGKRGWEQQQCCRGSREGSSERVAAVGKGRDKENNNGEREPAEV